MVPEVGHSGTNGLRQVETAVGERNPRKVADASYGRIGEGRRVIPCRDVQA